MCAPDRPPAGACDGAAPAPAQAPGGQAVEGGGVFYASPPLRVAAREEGPTGGGSGV